MTKPQHDQEPYDHNGPVRWTAPEGAGSFVLVTPSVRPGDAASAKAAAGATALPKQTLKIGTNATRDGADFHYKEWGTGWPAMFSHGWPLTADAFKDQMLFLAWSRHEPPTIVWSRYDKIFLFRGETPYRKDLPSAEWNLIGTEHFTLEEKLEEIALPIWVFIDRDVAASTSTN